MNRYFFDIYKTLNILCVEDDKDVLEIYKSLFSQIFKNVYLAHDGNEGFETFQKEQIDIVLSDNMMPNCSGLEMIHKIREVDTSVPIMLVTALENIEVLKEAISLQVNSFLKKPFTSHDIFSSFEMVAKTAIANKVIMQEQTEKILYNDYQEKLTFEKERTIIKNDLTTTQKVCDFQCDVVYRPKDTLSGDSYSIREIDEESSLLFLVDGMGKGISASVSAMLSSAFVNHSITKLQKEQQEFSLAKLLEEFRDFIGANMLELEVLSTSFFYCNQKSKKFEYAIFSMPPALYMKRDSQEVFKIKSNNPPLASYTQNIQIDSIGIEEITKMIIYTDGVNENILDNSQECYGKYFYKDFQTTKNIKEFDTKMQACCTKQDDDTTYFYLTKN